MAPVSSHHWSIFHWFIMSLIHYQLLFARFLTHNFLLLSQQIPDEFDKGEFFPDSKLTAGCVHCLCCRALCVWSLLCCVWVDEWLLFCHYWACTDLCRVLLAIFRSQNELNFKLSDNLNTILLLPGCCHSCVWTQTFDQSGGGGVWGGCLEVAKAIK